MKTLEKNLKNLLVGILVGLPLISFASGDINVVGEANNEKMDKIKVEIPELFDLAVSIMNDEGQVLYSETLKKGSKSAMLYNFSKLEDGQYTILSKGGHQEITKIIEIKDDNINVLKKEVENNPIFMVEDDLLKISFLNKDTEDIKISLNNSVSVFYDTVLEDQLVLKKALDISSLQRGNYYVDLAIGDKEHKFYFDVD